MSYIRENCGFREQIGPSTKHELFREDVAKTDVQLYDIALDDVFAKTIENIQSITLRQNEEESHRRNKFRTHLNKIFDELIESETSYLNKYKQFMARLENVKRQNNNLRLMELHISQVQERRTMLANKNAIISLICHNFLNYNKLIIEEKEKLTANTANFCSTSTDQLTYFKSAYESQLELITVKWEAERSHLVREKAKNWSHNFNQMRHLSEYFMNKKYYNIFQNDKKLEELRNNSEAKFRQVKKHLDLNLNMLQRLLQRIKYSCLLNREKLDYNFQILKRCEEENILIESSYKKKLNKLQEKISRFCDVLSTKEVFIRNERTKLVAELYEINNSIEVSKKNTRSLIKKEKISLKNVWLFNKSESEILLDQLLEHDKETYNYFLNKLKIESDLQKCSLLNNDVNFSKTENNTMLHPLKNWALNNSNKIICSANFVNNVLEKITNKSCFFLEETLLQILKNIDETAKKIIVLDHVLTALGVKKETNFQCLFEMFMQYSFCEICDAIYSKSSNNEIILLNYNRNNVINFLLPADDAIKDVIHVIVQKHNACDRLSLNQVLKQRRITCRKNHELLIYDTDVLKVLNAFLHTSNSKR